MNVSAAASAISPEVLADLEEVARQAALGGVWDAELVRCIRERDNHLQG